MAAGGGGWLRQGAVRATSHPSRGAGRANATPFFLELEENRNLCGSYIAGRRSVMGAGGN